MPGVGLGYKAFLFNKGYVEYWMATDSITAEYLDRKFPENGSYTITDDKLFIRLANKDRDEFVYYYRIIGGSGYFVPEEYINSSVDLKEYLNWVLHSFESFNPARPFEYTCIYNDLDCDA